MTILSAADHEHFIEHGWAVLPGLVPVEVVAAAVDELETDGSPGEAVEACMADLPGAIDELFGPRYTCPRRRGGNDMPRPHQPDGVWKEPTAHVDDAYPTTMPNGWAVGSFTFLTPVCRHGGAFVVFPGSYRRYRERLADACHCIKGAAQLPAHSGPGHEFLAQPGDVLLFHHLCGHTGSDNLVDPTTRHALLARWPTVERIVPGDRPFDDMSTIEKVNSARYLADRFGMSLHLRHVTDDADDAVLREGFGADAPFVTSAILHHGGCLHLFGVTEKQPELVRHWCSDTGLDWQEQEPLTRAGGGVRSLQIHQYDLDVLLAVTQTDGTAQLQQSRDLSTWHEVDAKSGVRAMTPWFVYAQYPSKVAGGQTLFEVDQAAADWVVCRWGSGWDTVPNWTGRSEALQAPSGMRIEDVTIAAHAGDSTCTFVVDLAGERGDGDSGTWYAQPKDIAVAGTPLQRLAFDGTSTPRCVRIVNRAHNYWLVTYLREQGGSQRLFWGEIDFSVDKPVLHEICSTAELAEARATVGFH